MDSLWLIPLLPAAVALVTLSLSGEGRTRAWSPGVARGVAAVAALVSSGLAVRAIAALRRLPAGAPAERVDVLGDWIPKLPVATRDAVGILDVPWGLRLDPKSTVLLLAVVACAVLAHVSASVRSARDPRTLSVRMSSYLSASVGFLVLVALGSHLPVVFAGWVGVVATSALIGSPSDAGVNRRLERVAIHVGVSAFMLAIGFTFVTFGTLDIRAVERAAATMASVSGPWGAVSTIGLFMAISVVAASGALASRSARLAAWLPVAAGLGVIWQVSALASRVPLAVGAGVAIGGLTVLLTRQRRLALS